MDVSDVQRLLGAVFFDPVGVARLLEGELEELGLEEGAVGQLRVGRIEQDDVVALLPERALVGDAVLPLGAEEYREHLGRRIVGGIIRGRSRLGECPIDLPPDRLFSPRGVGLAEVQDETAAVMDREIDDLQIASGREVSAGDVRAEPRTHLGHSGLLARGEVEHRYALRVGTSFRCAFRHRLHPRGEIRGGDIGPSTDPRPSSTTSPATPTGPPSPIPESSPSTVTPSPCATASPSRRPPRIPPTAP